MLEANLTNLEKKIDDLLASFDAQESAAPMQTRGGASGEGEGTGESRGKES
ncbi:hypothetical protein DSL72_008002 [Monilinia vaccinii-corymbosi]|uniref:Uncharacterized protein n=1 Tax=Monilinia vaccinii-corymbosi TaxID=61207 RepID=A0A8A3PIH5_9HELO|nr:hypothetical protein DSL72_008002 [Monilinia vaccinii-corymbosi]